MKEFTLAIEQFSTLTIVKGLELKASLPIIILLAVIIILLLWVSKSYTHKMKFEKEFRFLEKSLKKTNMELAVAMEQINSSDTELFEQFLEIQDQKEKLKISRERYRLAVEGAEVGIWDVDLNKNEIYLSRLSREIAGMEEKQDTITYEDVLEKILKADREEVIDKFMRYISKQIDYFQVKCRIKVSDGKYTWINIRGKALCDEQDKPIRIAGSISNINKEKIAEAKINRLAFYDPLTGLPNRTYFNQLMEDYIHINKQEHFALLFIDIDNFKSINEALGHSYGDEILCKIADTLKKKACENALVRFGGDEFVIVVMNNQNDDELRVFAEEVLSEFQKPFVVEGLEFFITLSIGAATYPFAGLTQEELLKHADIALNDVKLHGKNGYKLFSFALDESIAKRLKLERDLRQAIEHQEFELYYQPKLDMKSNRVIGYEALIRWHHPQRGLVSPLEFIPFAEETGLIIPIGEWVIYKAAQQLQLWHLDGHEQLTIAINLSVKQLQDAHLVERFKNISDQTGVDLSKLELEITESTALYDIDYAINVLNELKALGLKVSLDDFGTGYSSLNYLTLLPIDHLKIDKSFITNIINQKSGEQIIRSVISLAHACHLKVIAEGVETKHQLDFLRNEACDMIQGFYISQPVPKHEAIEFMMIQF